MKLPDTGKRKHFDTGAQKENDPSKGMPHLIPTEAMRMLAKRFSDGAIKYEARNWEKGLPLSNFVDSLMRHTWAFLDNETDEDHLGAIIWNAVCLAQTKYWIDTDKLPKELNDLHND